MNYAKYLLAGTRIESIPTGRFPNELTFSSPISNMLFIITHYGRSITLPVEETARRSIDLA